jgi:glutamyl-tRNA synthetase
MSSEELIQRFSFDRVQASPATFDYKKLEWMNGVYLRALPPEEYAERLVAYLREQGIEWDENLVRKAAPLVQEKITKFGDFPAFARFLFEDVEPDPGLVNGGVLAEAERALAGVEPFTADRIETALRGLAAELELKPREAFQPIRVAVTGSRISPGLFESVALLGKERSLERIRAAAALD